jgi:N-acetylglucosamine-6-phosphate deacetylase
MMGRAKTVSGQLLITHCRMLDSTEEASIRIGEGVIREIGPAVEERGCADCIDAEGRIAAPGFIDVHVQGAGGADVLDDSLEALAAVSRTCSRFGATGFLATTVYRPGGGNSHLALAGEAAGKDLGGARLLGIHLEGPFISTEKKGMIHRSCICPPSPGVLEDIERLTAGSLRMMTIAPELEGALDLVRRLAGSGVIASFGHSNASYEETLRGIDAGITHVTHLFNAMPALHHRLPGPLIAIFRSGGPTVQIIPDGVHLHPRVIRFAFELLGAQRCVTITDGMQALGLPDGKYIYNGVEYESKGGAARYRDGTLIGTALGMVDMVLRLKEFTGCSLETAVRTASLNPARLLGLGGKKGLLAAGMDADIVLLDHDYSVWATIVGGKVVYGKRR